MFAFLGGTSQLKLQSLPDHGLRLDPAVHASDPLHHPLWGKRDLEDFAFASLFGDQKKDSVFHLDIVVASDWLFAFLRWHLGGFSILWRDYFHAKYLLLIVRNTDIKTHK